MALILKKIYLGYSHVFNNLADPRADVYPLMNSPIPITIILLVYYKFVNDWGPKFMEKRQPYNIKKILLLFNVAQVIANGWMFLVTLKLMMTRFDWHCQTVDYSNSPEGIYESRLTYFYHLIKLADLLDTVFFILRKNFRQVSFLHVYHHIGMTGMTWIGVKFIPGGYGSIIGLINCFVHLIMYFYYLLTVWDDKFKKNVWWKKYITQLQLTQFALFLLTFGRLFFVECDYPKLVSYFFVVQNLFMTILFGEFYYKAYIKKKPSISGENAKKD